MNEASDPRPTIMVVDDSIVNLKFAKTILAEIYDVFTAGSAEKMFDLLQSVSPDLIFLDIDMPKMNGYEAIKILKSSEKTSAIPVIFLTALTDAGSEVDGLSLGAVDYITKPFAPRLLCKRVEIHLTMEAQRRTLEEQKRALEMFNTSLQAMVEEKSGKILELQDSVLATVADLVESRDDITGGHVARTRNGLSVLVQALKKHTLYSREIADWDLHFLLLSSQLHDVGKITIRDSILKKPGPLTREEFEEMKGHTCSGVKIIEKIATSTSESDFLRHAKIFAETHHEKWDGSGYPHGLRGEEIPLQGRLMAIVDVYDAIISERPYKKARSHEEAVRIIQEGRGTHFSPRLVDIFLEVEEQFATRAPEEAWTA
ncbi:MAG: response regulator [Deltaproteobacteria bacterium]|jgi:putative two-component system response regulator|nr:response regulator [Deltaproteobacteria bacterium]